MKQKRRKPKIITKKKIYPIQDSIFYKLSNKKKLAQILGTTLPELKIFTGNDGYNCFLDTRNEKSRHIEEPLLQLDIIHTRVASLLCRIQTFDGLHSGKKGYSNISNAKAHCGIGRKIITADLKSFYTTTHRLNVFDFFYNSLKCSSDVANLLSHILTYKDHIPTGSRISMPLAYFANKRMFDELEEEAKLINSKMTLYVDDLTFSGITLKRNFINRIECIAKKHGHQLHPAKTRFYGANDIKLITGTAVHGNKLNPRNRHLKILNDDMNEWHENPVKDDKLANRVVGRMTFLGSIDPRYKDKSRSFRQKLFN